MKNIPHSESMMNGIVVRGDVSGVVANNMILGHNWQADLTFVYVEKKPDGECVAEIRECILIGCPTLRARVKSALLAYGSNARFQTLRFLWYFATNKRHKDLAP